MGDISKVRAFFKREYRDVTGAWHTEEKKELAQFAAYDGTKHYYDYSELPNNALIDFLYNNITIDGKSYNTAIKYETSGCFFPNSFYPFSIFVDDDDIDYIRDCITSDFNLYPEYSYSTKMIFRNNRIAFKTTKDWYIFCGFNISFGKQSITAERDAGVSLFCMCSKYLPENIMYNDETRKWTHETSEGTYAEMVAGKPSDGSNREYYFPFFETMRVFSCSGYSLGKIINKFNSEITKFKKLKLYPFLCTNANPFIFDKVQRQYYTNYELSSYNIDITNSAKTALFELCYDLSNVNGVTERCFYALGTIPCDLIVEYLYNPDEKAPDDKKPGTEDDPNDDDDGKQPPDPTPDDDDRGGDGDHDDTSDPIPLPPIPNKDASGIGLITIWNPTSSQLANLGTKLWEPSVWDAIKQYFTNPMEAILGLAIIPVSPSFSSVSTIHLGGYDTKISSNIVSSDYVSIDLGSIPINRYYGSYLDYDNFTKISCYLPYIGEVEINPDQVMEKTLGLTYRVNVITGDCVAILTIDDCVFASYSGNCARQIPICQSDFSSIIQSSVSAITSIACAVATGGASSGAGSAMQLGQAEAPDLSSPKATSLATSLVSDVMNCKLSYKHASQLGLGAAQLAPQQAFLTITRPNLDLPHSYKSFVGYPSNMNMHLGKCVGFTQIEASNLSVPSATKEEFSEIINLLVSGVIF